jgi:hypothetical protein
MVLDALERPSGCAGKTLFGLTCHSGAGSQFTSSHYGASDIDVTLAAAYATTLDVLSEEVRFSSHRAIHDRPRSERPGHETKRLKPEGVWTTLCSNGFVEGRNSSQLVMLPRRLRDRGQDRPDVLVASELGDHSRALSPGADVENHKGFGDMPSAVTAARRPR